MPSSNAICQITPMVQCTSLCYCHYHLSMYGTQILCTTVPCLCFLQSTTFSQNILIASCTNETNLFLQTSTQSSFHVNRTTKYIFFAILFFIIRFLQLELTIYPKEKVLLAGIANALYALNSLAQNDF